MWCSVYKIRLTPGPTRHETLLPSTSLFRAGVVLLLLCSNGQMAIVARCKPHLGLGLADDLAIVGAVDPRQLVSVLLDKICQAQHHRRPVAAGGLAPDSPERLMAGFDGGRHVRFGGLGNGRPDGLIEGEIGRAACRERVCQ